MTPGLLLGWLGGGQPAVLRESHADAARYSSMGAVLIGTAALAALSSTFALTTAVGLPAVPAAIVGVLWGLLILSLDRMLVISMSRQTGFWRSLAAAAPRLGLALLIGTVISVPLVLRIFEPELNNELQVMHSENLIANQKKLDARFADIPDTQAKVDELQLIANGQAIPQVSNDPDVRAAKTAADQAQAAFDKADAKAQCELDGSCGSRDKGDGPAYAAAKKAADVALTRLNTARANLQQVTQATAERLGGGAASAKQAAETQLKTLVPALEARKADRIKAQAELDEGEAGNTGLLVRLEALDRLSAGHPTMWLAHLALMALFACIELLPVLAKLLSNRSGSLYERLEKMREDRAVVVEQRRQARQDELDEKHFDTRQQLEADKLDRQLESGKRANALLASKQEAFAELAIERWGEIATKRTDLELERWYQQHLQAMGGATQTPATQNPPAQPPATNGITPFPLNGQPGLQQNPTTPVAGP